MRTTTVSISFDSHEEFKRYFNNLFEDWSEGKLSFVRLEIEY